MQQGDPLVSAGYCLGTNDAQPDLKYELLIGHQDEGVLAGDVHDVISDIRELRQNYTELELDLNVAIHKL